MPGSNGYQPCSKQYKRRADDVLLSLGKGERTPIEFERLTALRDYPPIPEAPEPRKARCLKITTRELWLIFSASVIFHTLIFGVVYYVAAH